MAGGPLCAWLPAIAPAKSSIVSDVNPRRHEDDEKLRGDDFAEEMVRVTMRLLHQRSRLWAVSAAMLLALVASCGSETAARQQHTARRRPDRKRGIVDPGVAEPQQQRRFLPAEHRGSLTGSIAALSHGGYPFTFSYPASWTDNTGSVTVTVGPLLDAQTLTAVGLQPNSTVSFVQVADPSFMPALDVYRFALQNGDLTLDTFYQREQAVLSRQTTTQIGQQGPLRLRRRAARGGPGADSGRGRSVPEELVRRAQRVPVRHPVRRRQQC